MSRKSSLQDGSVRQLHQQLATSYRVAIVVGIVVCQWACTGYLLLLAAVHVYVDLPEMTYYANLLALPTTRRLSFWGYAHLVVAVLHVADTLALILSCLLSSRYARLSHKTAPTTRPSSDVRSSTLLATVTGNSAPESRRVYKVITWISDQVFGRRGVLGIESPLFDVIFSLRELVEITAQCLQLHKYSSLLGRAWINDMLVMMFVLDCWDSVLLHRLLHSREALRRVVSLTVDAILMIGTNVVIPAFILLPYVREVDVKLFTFSSQRLYVDQQFIAMVTENRSVLALSAVDGLSKIVPHISIFFSLRSLRCFLLLPVSRSPKSVSSTVESRANLSKSVLSTQEQRALESIATRASRLEGVGPPANVVPSFRASQSGRQHPSRRLRLRRIFVRFSSLLSVLAGLAVLILHARARQHQPMPGIICRMPQFPWFSSGVACAIVEHNCYRQRHTPNETSLAMLDANMVLQVMFTHCPSLTVPSELQTFTNLLGMEVFNSTIDVWSSDAALTARTHSQIVFIGLIRVNMTQLPAGLLHNSLPPSLLDIEISISNLTRLPSDLSALWHEMDVVYVEYSQLIEFPSVILELNPYFVSLVGNDIREIPSLQLLPEANPLVRFTLSENPIDKLPETMNATINILSLDRTRVTALPSWVYTQVRQLVYLPGTPFCASLGGGAVTTTASMSEPQISCDGSNDELKMLGRYPHPIMKPYRTP